MRKPVDQSTEAQREAARRARRAERTARAQALLDASGMSSEEAVLGGLHLRFAYRNGTGTPLLLCNGIGANLELLLPLIPELSQRPVLIVDMPGTGGSASGLFWPSPRRYARMLASVLEHLGWRAPVAVGGVSWGGALAQQFVRSFPERASHLILIATTPGITMFPGRLSALRHMITPQRYLSRRYLARHAGTIYGGEMRGRGEDLRHHALLMRPPRTSAYLQQVMAMYQFSSLPWLHKIRCPALVLSGSDDPLIRPANAHVLAALLPQAELHLLPDAGHLFLTMQAKRTAGLMENFIARHSSDS